MNSSISKVAGSILLGISAISIADKSNTITSADYIAATERYDIEAWASYDSVDRHEINTGTDRGAQLYAYRSEGGNALRVVVDYGLSHTDKLYCLLYKDGKLVKATESERRYRYGKDGEIAFCQPYPQAETSRIYFRGSEVICLSTKDKRCEAIRADPAKQEAILKGASDVFRQLAVTKRDAELQDVDFLRYF
jgi:hypothetical protein